MQELNFYLPSFTNNLNINLALLESMKMHHECFYENIRIAAIYGSFPNAIWNGGRCEFGDVDISKAQNIITLLNSIGIAIRYTFTNCLIDEEHLSDEYCNWLMELSHNGMNEVLVNSPILEKYLRSKYPRFKYILSTTAQTRGADCINKMCKLYDMVVADYRDVMDEHFLKNVLYSERNKVEILLNESCVINCGYRNKHYEDISRAQLLLQEEHEETKRCMYHDVSEFRRAYVSKDKLYNVLVPMGYSNFKIRGRELKPDKLIKEYLQYLVKLQYQNYIENSILDILNRGTN